jgi:predicted transcriptional regulator
MVKRKRLEIDDELNPLSPLEERIMSFLWKNPESTAAEISRNLNVPLSSIAATVDRLCKHGYLSRERRRVDKRTRYVYSPVLSREEAKKKMIEDILDTLMDRFEDIVVSYFNRRSGNVKR